MSDSRRWSQRAYAKAVQLGALSPEDPQTVKVSYALIQVFERIGSFGGAVSAALIGKDNHDVKRLEESVGALLVDLALFCRVAFSVADIEEICEEAMVANDARRPAPSVDPYVADRAPSLQELWTNTPRFGS